jgi:hypothetical protein
LNRYTFRFIPIFIICAAIAGCKKDNAPEPKNFGYFTADCKLTSWSEFSARYNADNQMIEIYRHMVYFGATKVTELCRTLVYENGELKRIVVPKIEPTELFKEGREAWTEVEYEYGEYGVTIIRKFGYEGIRNGQSARVETGRHEFKYANSRKPVEMLTYVPFNREIDDLRVRGKRTFEYDSRGNVSNEISESIINGQVQSRLPIKYYYDDYPNTVKVLNFINFEYFSVQNVFSVNNPVKTEYPGSVLDTPLAYDDHFNVIGRIPEAVVWDCK